MLSEKLDEVDQGIIGRLRENARTTFVDIGKALGVSDATVYNRVNRLIDMGLIRKFTIEVDESVLQERAKGFIQLNVKPGTMDGVAKNLANVNGIEEIYEVHGAQDLILKVEADSLDSLRSVILDIREVPDVVQSEFIPIFKTWRD